MLYEVITEFEGEPDFDVSQGFEISQRMNLLAGSEEFESSENTYKEVIAFRVSKRNNFV